MSKPVDKADVKVPERISAALKQQVAAAAALRENQLQLALKNIELADVERRLAMLRRAAAPVVQQAWCVDLTEAGAGEVATIEVPGEPQQVLIAPGCRAPGPGDGVLAMRELMSPEQAFFNAAILPGWQKFKPTYRTGTIVSVDTVADTATVTLDEARSSAQGLNVNQVATLVNIPVQYMSCHAWVFEPGDRCVVEFVGQDWEAPKVIGFESNPRACLKPWLMEFLIPDEPDWSHGRGWGRPFDDQGAGTLEVLEPEGFSAHRERHYAALALTAGGQWHAYPWINQKLGLGGDAPRYGNWQQRVILNGRKRLLQFNGTASFDPERKSLYEDRLGIYEGGRLIGEAPALGNHGNPNVDSETHLVGVGGYRDDWGVQWMIGITWTRRTEYGDIEKPVEAVLSVYATSPDISWIKIHEEVSAFYEYRWAFYAYLQWKFNVDGTEASTIVQLPGYYSDDPQELAPWPSWWPMPGRHGAVRKLQISSGNQSGDPPVASFYWNYSFNDFPVRDGAWVVYEVGQRFSFDFHTYWIRSYQLGDLSLGIDYDAKTNQLATAWRHLSITQVFQFGGQPDVYWSDMRFGISIYSYEAGVSDVLYFKRYDSAPVRWDLPAQCWGAVGLFDGSQGVMAFYVNTGTGKNTLVYRFNGDGHLFEPVWQTAPAHYQNFGVLPYRLGTLQDTWR